MLINSNFKLQSSHFLFHRMSRTYSQLQSPKVYIEDLDSPLGYHLVDLLRTDHFNPHSPTLIIGSSNKKAEPPILQTINFSQLPQICCRAVLDCDLVILNLQHSSHEAEIIIKFLESSHNSLTKQIRVIGLSSVMTWEGMKAYETEKETDKQRLLNAVLDESSWRRIVWTEKDYQKRIPNNFYIKAFQLENMLLKLNKFPKINASVVAHGMLYGRQSLALQGEIINSLKGLQVGCYGAGDNHIPLTHIETFLEALTYIIDQKQMPFALVCDQKQYTQRQLKQLINEVTSNTQPLSSKELLYLIKEQCDWSINLTIQSISTELSSLASRRNFQDYARESLLSDFCDYNCYKPKQYLVLLDKYDEATLKEVTDNLQACIKVIHQEDIDRIDQQIIIKMTPPEPQIPVKKQPKTSVLKPSTPIQKQIVHYYRQAVDSLLNNKKYHNFALICNQNILPFLNQQLIFSKLTEIVPSEPEETSDREGAIVFHSDQYYNEFGLTKPSNVITPADLNSVQPVKQIPEKYQFESSGRKDEQLILLNQYLLDNVLLPISEAKFALKSQKKQPTLRNFIEQLKEILARANNRSTLIQNDS